MTRDEMEEIVQRALDEDLPDITSEAIFDTEARSSARFIMKADGIVAGLKAISAVFAMLDRDAEVELLVKDGDRVQRRDEIARVSARTRALLAGERTALNLVQRASGIATMTRRYVDIVQGTRAKIYDTRKTAPGLRALDKHAVVAGGGENHRFALRDMFLIKNNHIDAAGSIHAAVSRCREAGRAEKIMVEVRDLDELRAAIEEHPDYILLDNMTPAAMAEAVAITGGRIALEASGGITFETLREIAETGVDRISVGGLTHSVKALDISMRVERCNRSNAEC